MFKKEFIKQHFIEYASFDIAILLYIFQFFFYVTLFGHPIYQTLTLSIMAYFIVSPIILFRLKNYREKNPITRLYVDLYFVVSLSMLLIMRVIYSTLASIKWQALIIPVFMILLIIYRLFINQNETRMKINHKIFLVFTILLNLSACVGLFVHMMFYQV